MSAAEQQLEGWPLPATLVDRTLSIRKCVAAFRRAASCSWDDVDPGMVLLSMGTEIAKSRHPREGRDLKRVEFEASKPRAKESMKLKEGPGAGIRPQLGVGHAR